MRRALPFACLSVAVSLFSTVHLHAQNDRFAYAITDLTKEGMGWNALRKLDLQTGQYSEVLLNGTDAKTKSYDAVSKKELGQQPDQGQVVGGGGCQDASRGKGGEDLHEGLFPQAVWWRLVGDEQVVSAQGGFVQALCKAGMESQGGGVGQVGHHLGSEASGCAGQHGQVVTHVLCCTGNFEFGVV